MKVKDVMVEIVSACRPENNLAEVAGKMWNDNCGSLPVLDGSGKVTSIITDRDICIALGTRNVRASELRVEDVSLPRVFSCGANDDVLSALSTMGTQDVRRLPVVDDAGKLAGILSFDDLLMHSGEPGISYEDVLDASKSIIRGHPQSAHGPRELVALATASGS